MMVLTSGLMPGQREEKEEERVLCLVKVWSLDPVCWEKAVYFDVSYFSS